MRESCRPTVFVGVVATTYTWSVHSGPSSQAHPATTGEMFSIEVTTNLRVTSCISRTS